jgi:hypothetical protein
MSQYIYYMNNVLQKTKSDTVEDTGAERHHNSTGNRLEDNHSSITPYQNTSNLLQLLSSRFE